MKTPTLPLAALAAIIVAVPLAAQEKPQENPADKASSAAAQSAPARVPLRVQVVISRYEGDKKISSEPFTMSVNAGPFPGGGDVARLRMTADVPVMSVTGAKDIEKATGMTAVAPIQYKSLGTSIDCTGFVEDRNDPGRFRLQITVEDTSVYPADKTPPGTMASSGSPVFRSFRLSNTAVLRDGQSTQFTTATDKYSGQVVKVDVTLTVLK